MQTLFDYQQRAVDETIPEALRRGAKRLACVACCGAGKTSILAELCRRAASKGNTVTVTAHRRKLVQQLAERMAEFGVRYTIEMAEVPDEPWVRHDPGADIVIGSMQTMVSRIETAGVRRSKIVIPDEAHTITGPAYRALLKSIDAEYMLGFTATPCNTDGSGFGPSVFDSMVTIAAIEELINRPQPRLVPVDVFAPVGVGKRRRKGLGFGVSGDPVKQWIDHAAGLSTITFCRTRAECCAVRDMYLADGIKAVHIDGDTDGKYRDEVLGQLKDGDIKVLVCTPALMGVGVDIPYLECVQLLTKNHSPITQWQTVGREQRIADGKTRAVLLDHAAAVYTHGMPNVSPVWTLSEDDSVQRLTQQRQEDNPAMKPNVCPACGCVSAGVGVCPKCQTLLAKRKTAEVGGEREALRNVQDIDGPTVNAEWQKAWRGMLYGGAAIGMTCAAAACRFKSKYGVWPDVAGVHPVATRDDGKKKVGEVFPNFIRKGAA